MARSKVKNEQHLQVVEGFEAAPATKPADFYSESVPDIPASDSVFRVLAIGDTHDDVKMSKDRFTWIGKHAAETAPDHIVQIGDLQNWDSLSSHTPDETNEGKYKPRFMAELNSVRRALDAMYNPISAAGLDLPTEITLGNHDQRIWTFENENPASSGMLQRDFITVLAEYGIHAHQYGKYIDLGGVKFTHAPKSIMGRPIGGQQSSLTIARQAGSDIVCGHTHRGNVTVLPRLGTDRVTVIDLGCALPQRHVEAYAKHSLTGWTWGVWDLLIQGGHIEGHNFIPMAELERRYGRKSARKAA